LILGGEKGQEERRDGREGDTCQVNAVEQLPP